MSKWKRICAVFLLIVGLYKYCSLRSSYQEGRVGIPLTGLNPTLFFLCLFQTRTWIANIIRRCPLLCGQRGDCLLY